MANYTIEKEYRKIIKTFSVEMNIYNQTIRMQKMLYNNHWKHRIKILKETSKHMKPTDSLIEFLLLKNQDCAKAHYSLLARGHIYSSYSQLRTMYETIIRIYLIMTDPEGDGNIIFKAETKQKLTEYENKRFKEMQRFKVSCSEKSLFNESKRKQLRLFYSKICDFVHPSIRSLMKIVQAEPNIVQDSLKLGVGLSYVNIILMTDFYKNDKFLPKKKIKQTFDLIYKLGDDLIDIFPDKNNLLLNFKEYKDFFNFIQKS